MYKIAAEEGNSNAQESLAYLYEKGEGTEKNTDRSIYWYKKIDVLAKKPVRYTVHIF